MISDFDKQNLHAIIRFDKPHYDWFTARLLRLMFRSGFDAVRFEVGFPEEWEAICGLYADGASKNGGSDVCSDWNAPARFTDEDEFASALYYLLGKADAAHQMRLCLCFPKHTPKWADWFMDGCTEGEFIEHWKSVSE